MKRCSFLVFLCLAALPAAAQRPGVQNFLEDLSGRNRFSWEYDADLQYHLNNRSFGASLDAYSPSSTIHTVVFTPTVGFSIQQNRRVNHRLAVGVEFAHDMGSRSWRDLPRELILYYDGHVRTRRGSFEGLAGIFPRRFLEGTYSQAFFSDSTLLCDRNLEGALVKWRADRFYAEAGLDWVDQRQIAGRSRLQVMTAGEWQATRWLSLGWTGSLVYYSKYEPMVYRVENHLAEPWFKMDFSRRTRWQELSLQAGLMVAYQRDHAQGDPEYLTGGEVTLRARRYSLSLENSCYFGDNLMPLYGRPDVQGVGYGHEVFFGNPFYRSDFYDRLQLAWEPQITPYLRLRVATRFHFHVTGLVGWEQQLSLHFSLDALRNRDLPAGRCL